ncbi:hypothetical protein ACMA1I_15980 [Pontibacter sp. 13R65]|uniref:hypothetical protein n=1 Tax=Pontibacter sp. 13R65 TaxID=3127458 RepID=UPI00301D974C
MKSFYEFNPDSPEERQEREKMYPELSKFHIALREELSEEEYFSFYSAEKESFKPFMIPNQSFNQTWRHA